MTRAPSQIVLADVYLALDESLISFSEDTQPHDCSIERALHSRVQNIMVEIEQNLIEQLKATTIIEFLA